ncbi:hypothetical protein BKA67DRAFT_654469 [Truncatella angustata]|uniref:Uncharacterized protein n=1 Tax=Truncatella angustata TaxID=152316 RepID=A0A9P8V0Q1_9PEZI|nr:uncharacterized protein BKA67DRAFT_654469 [Truncatella angustata]KAH6661349.1 hypothetical protein BKA67DRAFT_654469 [Truncatella angustata]
MAKELAPRLLLTQILRTILLFFSAAFLANYHTYIGPFRALFSAHGSMATSWAVVAWNAVCISAAAVHPYLQRFADGLPFPVSVTVRGRTVLAYGDSDEGGDGLMAPLAAKLVFAFVDVVLATLLVVFSTLARDLAVECGEPRCLGRVFHVQGWILNAWLVIVVVEYLLAVIQGFEALGIWYSQRYLKKQGQISLA